MDILLRVSDQKQTFSVFFIFTDYLTHMSHNNNYNHNQ